MSIKTIGFPSNPPVDQEYRGWVWDGEKWVSDAVKGGLWEQNGDDIHYSDGNVGIGVIDPITPLEVAVPVVDDTTALTLTGTAFLVGDTLGLDFSKSDTEYASIRCYNAGGTGELLFRTGGANERMRIDADGNVGIGSDNPEVSLHLRNPLPSIIFDDQAFATRKARIQSKDGNLDIEADYNNGTNTSRITFRVDNDEKMRIDSDGKVGIGMEPVTFDLSAKEQLKEWKTKAKKASWPVVTDGAFEQEPTEDLVAEWIETRAAGDKLQVNGDGFFAGAVKSNAIYSRFGSAHGISFADNSGSVSVAPVRSGTDDGTVDLGQSDRRWKDAHFSGTVTANKFVGDGSGLTGVGGGLPSGDYTHNGKITATDFISTSDERLKENITPMPIGLIDDIKPVSWEWKDGSGPSAGVVAQQLQAVGLGDYVSEDEDGQLGVNYQALTAILLAEVIELKRSLK